MTEKEEGKVYRIVLAEVMGMAGTVVPSTIQSAISATGSFGQYQQYFEEASRILKRGSMEGTISPNDITYMKEAIERMSEMSRGYQTRIIDLTKRNEVEKLAIVKGDIDGHIPDQQKMIQEMYEKTLGTKAWQKLSGFFAVESSGTEKTAFFKGLPHKEIVALLVKWIQMRDSGKMFGDIIHGLGESGLDIIVQVISPSNPRFGIQVKNNEDVAATDFPTKLKAQITESKAHQIRGLILFFAADVTNSSIERGKSGICYQKFRNGMTNS